MPDFGVEGAQQLSRLAVVLKMQGRGDLRRELLAGLRKAAVPARTSVPQSARALLPRRGGLNEYVASGLHVATRSSLAARGGATVRIEAQEPRHDLVALERGRVRHPVFGNRKVWATEKVAPGFFALGMAPVLPEARRQAQLVIQQVIQQLMT